MERTPEPLSRELTLLLTDIEGSTEIWDRDRGGASRAIERHNRICEEAVATFDGRMIMSRGEGDSTFSVFEDPADAVSCALAIAVALADEPWPVGAEIRTRAAIHTGTLEIRGDNVFGPPINRAARLRSLAHGQQTVLSAITAELVSDRLPDQVTLMDLGVHGLRGLSKPERVFQLCDPRLPCEFPPLNSIDALRHNVPSPITSFIGRSDQVHATLEDLKNERVVTLTGVGGTGKSRLAMRVASEVVDRFDGGVWFVEIGPLRREEDVAPAVASVLRVRESSGSTVEEALVKRLRTSKVLLVLDGCEHLVAACASLVYEIVSACPDVRFLVTSREALGLVGEHVRNVPPMATPGQGSTVEESLQSDAVRLFVERASSRSGAFKLDPTNLADVVEICRHLDGIPLAIELAASRAAILGAKQTLSRLADRFSLLTGGERGSRRRTLLATLEWSTDLLTDAEGRLYPQLGVFVGRFTLEDVEAVCEAVDAIDLVQGLVEKSLVNAGDGDFWLLETIRAHAISKLDRDPRTSERISDRHMEHFAARAVEWGRQIHTSGAELERAREQIRAALERALHKEADDALRMVAALWPFWIWRGELRDGRSFADRALSLRSGDRTEMRADALRAAGSLAVEQGDIDTGTRHLSEALDMQRELANLTGEAWLTNALGVVSSRTGRTDEALEMYGSALELFRKIGDELGEAVVLGNIGVVEHRAGKLQRAREHLSGSIALGRRIGHEVSVAGAMTALGHVAMAEGNLQEAEDCLRSGLRLSLEAGARSYEASALEGLAAVSSQRGDHGRALHLLSIADRVRSDTGQATQPHEQETRERILASARDSMSVSEPDAPQLDHAIPLDRAIDLALR